MQVLLRDRTAVGMGTTAHDVAVPDTSLPLLNKQAFMVEAAYQAAPGASSLPAGECHVSDGASPDLASSSST